MSLRAHWTKHGITLLKVFTTAVHHPGDAQRGNRRIQRHRSMNTGISVQCRSNKRINGQMFNLEQHLRFTQFRYLFLDYLEIRFNRLTSRPGCQHDFLVDHLMVLRKYGCSDPLPRQRRETAETGRRHPGHWVYPTFLLEDATSFRAWVNLRLSDSRHSS